MHDGLLPLCMADWHELQPVYFAHSLLECTVKVLLMLLPRTHAPVLAPYAMTASAGV